MKLSTLKMAATYIWVRVKASATSFSIWLNNKQVLKAWDKSSSLDFFLHN